MQKGNIMGADKNNKVDAKPDHSLILPSFVDQLAYCMMAGEIKYGTFNFLKGHTVRQLTAATSRHLKRIEAGEDIDEDTTHILEHGYTRPNGTFIPGIGKRIPITHNACIAANQLMMIAQREVGTLTDDRCNAAMILEYQKQLKETELPLLDNELIDIDIPTEYSTLGGGIITHWQRETIHRRDLDKYPGAKVVK